MAILSSTWAHDPILLTEPLSSPVWNDAGTMPIPGGKLLVKNDALFLYASLDLTEDVGTDPDAGDYFWFSFDRNRSGTITPNVDTSYGIVSTPTVRLVRSYYLGPNVWTGILSETSTSQCRKAYETTPNSATPHRVWKIRFALSELNVSLLPWFFPSFTKFGIRVHSHAPNFTHDTPNNFSADFSALHTLYLSRRPTIDPALLGPVMGSVGLIPTTKINGDTGKATTDADYSVIAQDASFGGALNIIGNRTRLSSLTDAGARKYKVQYQQGTTGVFTDLRSNWANYRWNGSDYILESFGPDAGNFYAMPSPSTDYSIDDLLIQVNSTTLSQGIHQFQTKFFTEEGTPVPCETQILTMYIDNTAPDVRINAIFANGVEKGVCSMINLGPTQGLTFKVDVFDKEGSLGGYSLAAGWGDNQSAPIGSGVYNPATGPNWQGHHGLTLPTTGAWIPLQTCAHGFILNAWSRITNGYDYISNNQVMKFATVIKS